jgi:uncharacterized protein (TIGR02246 family)
MRITAEDRWEINDLYARYAFGWDEGDGDAWAAVFTADGIFHRPEAPPLVGRDALAAFVTERKDIQPGIRHFNTNLVVEVDGDVVRGTAYCFAPRIADGQLRLRAIGRYHDVLVRLDEGWRFAERRIDQWLPRDQWDVPVALELSGVRRA